MSDYEELDSFTEALIRRNRDRQALLETDNDPIGDQFDDSIDDPINDDIDDRPTDLSVSLNLSNDLKCVDNNVLKTNSRSNIDLIESVPPPKPTRTTSSDRLVEVLQKVAPNRRRVPLNQRLNSIARCYESDDTENLCYIDDEVSGDDNEPVVKPTRSPIKTMRQPVKSATDSPPKKRLLLNERLNQIARSYGDDDDSESNAFTPNKEPKEVSKSAVVTKTASKSWSPTKPMVQTFTKTYSKTDLTAKKSPLNGSPVKMSSTTGLTPNQNNVSPIKKQSTSNLTANQSKVSPIKSPQKKQISQIVSNNITQKLSHMGFQKSETTATPPAKLIYNSNDNKRVGPPVVNGSSNVSAVRKQFEQNCDQKVTKIQTPETLSLKAKTSLFEKAIEAENEAKSKQYSRKRNATPIVTQTKAVVSSLVTKTVIATKTPSDSKPVIPRQKSDQKLDQNTPNVSNNILKRRQLLEERLFGSETTTANAYKKELASRQQELELLKRPIKANKDNEHLIGQNCVDSTEPRDEIPESVDDETAHQTVCDAFQEIEDYGSEQSDNDLNSDTQSQKSDSKFICDKNVDIEYESPTKRNRLYPSLEDEDNELCTQSYESLDEPSPPPVKPPRVYEEPQPSTSVTTPLRTISFYRREQSLKASANNTPTVAAKSDNYNDSDLRVRNREIQKKIESLKLKVDQEIQIAGQASQALNLCLETTEFKGSEQHVEAEKVLLVCGQKRIAFLNEIQRLKSKLTEKTIETDYSRGSMTVRNLRLPIKGEFLVARAKGTVPEVHHLICIITNGANVFVSNLVDTDKDIKNGVFEFEMSVRLNDLINNFSVAVTVYDLLTMKHDLSHRIKNTPKKKKSTMKSPSVRSPGGPNAVLSTSFQMIGAININLNNYYKKGFKLDNFCFSCPLEGTISLKTDLTVEHNYFKDGFFDVRDSSGFWNLRWVVLRGHKLGFYRFPEDVTTKSPLGLIDLRECINPNVLLMRQTSTRPNSIALITVAKAPKDMFTKGGSIPRSHPIKYIMSGQNKAESTEWAQHISLALNAIRMWNSDAVKPYRSEEFERLIVHLD